jgi:hypothetical protein
LIQTGLGEPSVPIRIQLPLVIGADVRAKIEARHIYEDHLEEIVREASYRTHARRARQGGVLLLGRDRGGRYLLVALYPSRDYPGRHVVATSRLATDEERRLYQRHIGGQP